MGKAGAAGQPIRERERKVKEMERKRRDVKDTTGDGRGQTGGGRLDTDELLVLQEYQTSCCRPVRPKPTTNGSVPEAGRS